MFYMDDLPFHPVEFAVCKDCGADGQVNVDTRCATCMVKFVHKLRSVAIIAEPVGLKEARRGGFAKY